MKKLILIICFLLLITGCSFTKDAYKKTTLVKSLNNMNKKLNNYNYQANIELGIQGYKTNFSINCTKDNKKNLEYCITNDSGFHTEIYYDYDNLTEYLKQNDNKNWEKLKIGKNNINYSWFTLITSMSDIKETKKDNQTIYKGKIEISKLISIIPNSKLNVFKKINKKIDVSVYLDRNDNITKIEVDGNIMTFSTKINIEYSNFNIAEDILLPN